MSRSRYAIRCLLALLLSLGLTSPLHAEEEEVRWYDVEVLLFVQQSQTYRESEQWPIDYTQPVLENSRKLLPENVSRKGGSGPIAFRRLTSDELTLSADAARIKKAPDIELLSHFGWRQPGMPQDKAIAIAIDESLLTEKDSEKTGVEDNSPAVDGNVPAYDTVERPRLEGTLRLILSRYLHIEADLLYREPLSTEEASILTSGEENTSAYEPSPLGTATQPQDLFSLVEQTNAARQSRYQVYRLQQSRRMRSNELHYLDHPVFGLAVKVTPFELPVAEAQTAQEGNAD